MLVNISDFSVVRQRSITGLTSISDFSVSPLEKHAFPTTIIIGRADFYVNRNHKSFPDILQMRCRKTCIRSDANISLTKRYIDGVLTKYKKVL